MSAQCAQVFTFRVYGLLWHRHQVTAATREDAVHQAVKDECAVMDLEPDMADLVDIVDEGQGRFVVKKRNDPQYPPLFTLLEVAA